MTFLFYFLSCCFYAYKLQLNWNSWLIAKNKENNQIIKESKIFFFFDPKFKNNLEIDYSNLNSVFLSD